ncbi:MAG: VCBS repeat-containing protein [Saprospiraceae bacterium]|nr:VCBS repeat-containing protein [Saprospiraceae bacterium]
MAYFLKENILSGMRIISVLLLLLVITSCSENTAESSAPSFTSSQSIFQKVDPSQSGISFSNDLVHNLATKENLLDFDYFYNGAGVGIADINNDGLTDIFFCGNQVDNRLYLNKGNLEFEDISKRANINTSKEWSNGVTFADVNQDGWLDIYVAQGGPKEKNERKNLLFINQRDLTFVESAEEYGLADQGFSTQSAFFDYDKDGDLDCIVMNENPLYGIDPINLNRILAENKELLYQSSSHFYKNENGQFIDVTADAGLLRASFGLGLVVSDINNDGWLDIYMANDYFIPDAMFINQKNGSFFDEIKSRTSQVSFYGMGADIADLNNDLHQDILVLDMASADHYRAKTLMASMNVDNFNLLVNDLNYAYQYMFNSIQLNQSNHQFKNIAHQLGIAKTDWSWAGLMNDFDNDGWKDILVTNGYRRYALDNDFKAKVIQAKQKYNGNVPLSVKNELYESIPSEKLSNLLFANKGDLKFEQINKQWGLDYPSYSNGAAHADLDNDGDLDLVVNNIDETAFLFQNKTSDLNLGNYIRVEAKSTLSNPFAKVYIYYNGHKQMSEIKGGRGYFSFTEQTAHFGIGSYEQVDSIRVEWISGKISTAYNVQPNQVITFDESLNTSIKPVVSLDQPLFTKRSIGDTKLFYRHKENTFNDFEKEILLPYKQSTRGPKMTKADVNGDGQIDLFIGGAAGQISTLFLQEDGKFVKQNVPAFEEDKMHEDIDALFFDLDRDGDQDLYLISGGNAFEAGALTYEDRIYINDGFGQFQKTKKNYKDEILGSGGSIAKIDIDNDDDMDLIIGNRIIPQHYPKAAPSLILENINGSLKDVTLQYAPELSDFGMINDILVTDFDNDGKKDFIVVGEWSEVGFFQNQGGSFKNVFTELGLSDMKGWWFSVTETDVNNDGQPDYIIGNVGLNTKFKASPEKAFKVFANDFDENGTLDVVLSKKYKDKYVPVRGKECSSQQMPFISEKFETYDAFAKASITDIFEDKLKESYSLEVNEFHSVLLINRGKYFEKKKLPAIIQSFPLLSCVVKDLNKDGFEDLIVAGTIYNTEVETPRWDAGVGMVMISNQKDNYQVLMANETGLYIDGNVKDLDLIQMKSTGKEYLIASRNNNVLSIFELNAIKNPELQ